MIKNVIVSVVLLWTSVAVVAQEAEPDSTMPVKPNFYFGLQANQLIKEIFNFSNSSSSANNPYLLTLGINNASSGWGTNIGFGLNIDRFVTENDSDTRTTISNNFNFRAGFEKKWSIGKRIGASAGADLILNKGKTETKTEFIGGGSSSTSRSESNSLGGGLGPRVTLNYSITNNILLGTESTYYFTLSKTENSFTSGGGFSNPNETTFKQMSLNFSAPLVIFLMYKF